MAHVGKHLERTRHRTYLDTVGTSLDLPPTDRLVRPRAGIAAVKLLRRIDIHRALGPVPHQTRIRNMMLHHAAAQNDHAGPLGPNGHGIDGADILHDIDAQLAWRRLESVKVEHIAQAPVRQGRAEDGDIVLGRPIADGRLVIDLPAQPADDLARRPAHGVRRVSSILLLVQHGVQDGHDPVFEEAVVGVGHDEVADAVHALGAQGGAVGGEGAEVGGREALDEVFLDAAGCRDDGGDVSVLSEVAEGFAQAGGD